MKKIIFGMIAFFTLTFSASAQEEPSYNGAYGGIEVGQLDGDLYAGFMLGMRKQTANNWVWGLEGAFGEYDVEKRYRDYVDYKEYSGSLLFGKAYGKGLLFATAGLNIIESDVGYFSISDTDFKAGLGYEYKLSKLISLRLKAEYVNNSEKVKTTAGLAFSF